MKLGEFVKGSTKNADGSSQNFMRPGAGLSSYDGDKRAAVEEELKTKQEDAHLNSLTKKLLNAGNNNNTATV